VAIGEHKEFHHRITITNEEENQLKIPEEKQGWSAAVYADAHDLRRLNQLPSICNTSTDSPQRPRQSQASSSHLITPISLPMLPKPNYVSSMQLIPTFDSLDGFH
jgi:hypothetical protein